MLVLEEYHHAKTRGAPILAEVLGVGYSGDAFHITAPEPTGSGATRAMLQAVEDAGGAGDHSRAGRLSMGDVDYVNAHATFTPVGDAEEMNVIRLALSRSSSMESENSSEGKQHYDAKPQPPLLVSSTKGATGHLLSAAGAIEAALPVMAVSEDTVPHTRNLDVVSDDTAKTLEPADATAGTAQHRSICLVQHDPMRSQAINLAMSNIFGFGGTNVSLLFGKADDEVSCERQ